MPTRTEIENRVNRIISIFQQAMPPISAPYPSITVATQRTYRDVRALLVAQVGSEAVGAPAEDYTVELVTGPKGNAILVRKEQIQTLDHLYHALWTILGRFYMMATRPATPDRQGEAEKPEVVEIATDFWTVFAPEAVSYRVERFLINSTGKGGSFEWTEAEWRSITDELHIQLMKVYGQRGIVVSELAILLSSALADDLLVDIIEKARAGTLPGREGEAFDPVGIDKMPQTLRAPMRELVALLEMQLGKERFWEADTLTMARIGDLLTRLNDEYVSLIADQILLDELDAMEIPKDIPEDLGIDLPEID